MPLARSGGQDDGAGHQRAAALERRAQRPELFVLQPELELDVIGDRRPGVGQVSQQPGPGRILGLHPRQLGPADGIDERQ